MSILNKLRLISWSLSTDSGIPIDNLYFNNSLLESMQNGINPGRVSVRIIPQLLDPNVGDLNFILHHLNKEISFELHETIQEITDTVYNIYIKDPNNILFKYSLIEQKESLPWLRQMQNKQLDLVLKFQENKQKFKAITSQLMHSIPGRRLLEELYTDAEQAGLLRNVIWKKNKDGKTFYPTLFFLNPGISRDDIIQFSLNYLLSKLKFFVVITGEKTSALQRQPDILGKAVSMLNQFKFYQGHQKSKILNQKSAIEYHFKKTFSL